jgi:glycosyltransferase involved in cell wall biosynthesis
MAQYDILYFSIISNQSGSVDNGGTLYHKTIIQRLYEEGFKQLIVKFEINQKGDQYQLYSQIDANHYVIKMCHPESISKGRFERIINKIYCKIPLLFEELARSQHSNIEKAMSEILNKHNIKMIMTDYLYSLLFYPGYKKVNAKKIIVTCNDETMYIRDYFLAKNRGIINLYDKLTLHRLSRFEKKSYQIFDKIISIGPEIRNYLPETKKATITCYLDDRPKQWKYTGSKKVFFIGNYNHFPNASSVNYLLDKIVPKVCQIMPDIKFSILGTSPEQISTHSHYPNVDFFGTGNYDDLQRLFLTSDLLLCPSSSTYGQKFKIAEALAYGTPFLGSRESLLGYPYLSTLPYAPLENPDDSVAAIVDLLTNQSKLISLSEKTKYLHSNFIKTQKGIWRKTLSD